MKLKLTKSKITAYQLLFGLVLIASTVAANISGSQVYAAISVNQLKQRINSSMRNYCAPVSGQNYDKCLGSYTTGAEAVYIADSEATVNNQKQTACSPPLQNWVQGPPTISNCSAVIEGIAEAQQVLGKTYYNSGKSTSSKPSKPGNPTKPKTPAADNPPLIDQCKSIKDKSIKNECIKNVQDCNNLAGPINHVSIPACKKQAIADAKKKAAAKDDPGKDPDKTPAKAAKKDGGHQCGNLPDDNDNVSTVINFGCLGPNAPEGLGPIQDLVFALVRFGSVGVGIAVTVSLIIAGIQYSTAEGNPDSSQKAKLRVQQALIGLAIYLFAFSALQYLIPGGIFN